MIPSRPAAAAALLAASLLTALPAAAADAAHGQAVFAGQCASCHSVARGGPTLFGPDLFGVGGRKAGSVPGYAYSSALKTAGYDWSPERLHAFLSAPSQAAPGTKMSYGGLKNPAQLDDVIAYLDGLK